ncbi:MAG: hypothetical protein JXO51_04615 [Candidatus Aminicenantes bacterium]|nr:hypothetical protein [Candidatus Aminicenantes bacterium]
MKKSLILILCGLLLGVVAAVAVTQYVIPRWQRSAVDNTYWQVASRLDQGGEAFVYLHAEQFTQAVQAVLASVKKNVAALPEAQQAQASQGLVMAEMMFKGYGLEEVSGLGYSSFALRPGLHRVRAVLHHRPGRNKGLIWNITGPAPRALDEMALFPAGTALAFVSDYDIVKLIEWMGQIAPQMAGQEGQDPAMKPGMAPIKAGLQSVGIDADRLFKSYGGRLGFLLTLDPEKRVALPLGAKPVSIPEPAFALLVRVQDSYIFDTLKDKLAAMGQTKSTEDGGVKKLAFPRLPAPFPLEPVIAQKGEWLLAASRLSLVDDVLAPRSPRLSQSDEFRAISYKLPLRGNGFSFMSPLLPRLVSQALRENLVNFPAPAALERITAFLDNCKGFCQVWENTDQGLVYTIHHGLEISSLPGLIDAFIEIGRQQTTRQPEPVPSPPQAEEGQQTAE